MSSATDPSLLFIASLAAQPKQRHAPELFLYPIVSASAPMDLADSNRLLPEEDAAVLQLSLTFTSELELERVVQLIVEKTRIALGAEVCVLLYRMALDEREWHTAHSESYEHDIDIGRWEGNLDSPLDSIATQSTLTVPITSRKNAHELLGRLVLGHREPSFFTSRHERLATSIAAQASVALSNAIAFERLRRERDEGASRGGHIVESVAIARDITEDRRQKELERHIAERTFALAEANRALADANRELESFSYTVSHDLRAPIRHISGFVDLLGAHAADSLDEKGKRWLRTIADASRQMGALIDALLSFSRMGRSEIEKGRVDLDRLVDDVLIELEPDWRGRQITWKKEHLPVVRGDATMLRIVFTNLLSNAVKYTKTREEAQIEIGADDDASSTQTTLWVRDNGIGFDMEYSDKLFGVFQRLHSNVEVEGTGIGLATVRRIIERHGGHAWAYGVPGHGATFYFTLPHHTAREDGPETP